MVKGFFASCTKLFKWGKIQTTFQKNEIVQCHLNVTQKLHGAKTKRHVLFHLLKPSGFFTYHKV